MLLAKPLCRGTTSLKVLWLGNGRDRVLSDERVVMSTSGLAQQSRVRREAVRVCLSQPPRLLQTPAGRRNVSVTSLPRLLGLACVRLATGDRPAPVNCNGVS